MRASLLSRWLAATLALVVDAQQTYYTFPDCTDGAYYVETWPGQTVNWGGTYWSNAIDEAAVADDFRNNVWLNPACNGKTVWESAVVAGDAYAPHLPISYDSNALTMQAWEPNYVSTANQDRITLSGDSAYYFMRVTSLPPGFTVHVALNSPPAPPSPPPTAPSPPPTATGVQDPHLVGAHGDKMDFRGRNATLYAILSAPRFSFALRTHDATFIRPGYSPKLVHGSFFTQAVWKVQTAGGDVLVVNTSAARVGFDVGDASGRPVASRAGVWQSWRRDDLFLLYKQATLVVRAAGWETNVTRKPVYNGISGPSWRLDLAIRPLNRTVGADGAWPHGILGQTWDGDDVAIDGAQDEYDRAGTQVWTTSMAEGALEGVADDYALRSAYDHNFKYSRFAGGASRPRNRTALTGTRRVAAGRGAEARGSD